MNAHSRSYREACEALARLGGNLLMDYGAKFETREKAPNDLVTDADLASQRAIHDQLQNWYPAHQFLGEEELDLPMMANPSEYRWIVDPLDGTMNFVHQLPSFSVSVALQFQGQIVAGAVYDPWLDEMYSADDQSRPSLNGRPIRVSGCTELSDALAVISLPASVKKGSPEVADLVKLIDRTRGLRRLGSAALNLCYVAAGRLDLYWATSLNCWDIAAGYLILQRAGGSICQVDGSPLNLEQPRMIAAASDSLNRQVQALLGTP